MSDSTKIFLKEEFERRKVINPAYSLRAFARKLDLSPAFLSKVFSGKKRISMKAGVKISRALKLSHNERELLYSLISKDSQFSSRNRKKKTEEAISTIDLDAFQVISDWYHYALLELTRCKDFQSEISWMAKRLKISPRRVVAAIGRLKKVGLMNEVNGVLRKQSAYIDTPTDQANLALRNFHSQMIHKGLNALESQPVDSREITGITFAINPKKLNTAKTEIRRFLIKMSELLEDSESSEVYQLNIQLFQLTERERKHEE